jgi:hypothetical protein
MFNIRKLLLNCRAAFAGKVVPVPSVASPISPIEIAFPFERKEIRLEDGTALVLSEQAKTRWTGHVEGPVFRPFALYELKSGEYVALEHAAGKFVMGRKLDDYWALYTLICMEAELPPKLQQLFDAGEWRKKKEPRRDLSFWGGRGMLKCDASQSAHEVVIADLIKEIIRSGVVLIQLLRGQLEKNSKWEAERRGEFVVALFSRYPVELDRWWGAPDRIPPATVGILDLQWSAGTENMRQVVQDMQTLVEPSLACICGSGRRIDNPGAPTYEEQQAAEEALRQCAPQLETLIVNLQGHLDALVAGKVFDNIRQSEEVKIPSDSAFLAYGLCKFAGRTQTEVATMIARATGGTTSQGTVSRWVREVEAWVAAKNPLPKLDIQTMCRAFATDPSLLDMGPRMDGLTGRQRDKPDAC